MKILIEFENKEHTDEFIECIKAKNLLNDLPTNFSGKYLDAKEIELALIMRIGRLILSKADINEVEIHLDNEALLKRYDNLERRFERLQRRFNRLRGRK